MKGKTEGQNGEDVDRKLTQRRYPAQLSQETYDVVKRYSVETGVPIVRVLEDAMQAFIPAWLSRRTLAAVEDYSNLTGTSVGQVFEEALADWIDTIGAARLEVIQERASSDITDARSHQQEREVIDIADRLAYFDSRNVN